MRVDNGATRIENRPTQFNPAMRSVQTGSNGTAVDVTRSQTSNGSDAQGLGGSSRDVIDLGRNILDTAESLSSASGQDASEVMKKVVQWILSAIEGSGAGTTATGVSLDGAASSGSTIDPSGLAGKLPGTGEVSEEQLYAAILEQRIGETAGPEAAKAFAEEFQSEKQRLRRGDGYVPVEEAAQNALRTLSENGEIDGSAAEKINGEAFRAAQLDDNGSLLYDDRGGPGDPTKATASISDALERANRQLARFRSGIDRAEPRSLAAQSTKSPQGQKVDGPDGFLWKPESESNGNLVVLVPKEYAHQVSSLQIQDGSGAVLAEGRSNGYGNGGREHFRFDRPGGRFPEGVVVELKLKNGSVVRYEIPTPSERYD
ncbi:MAG: hypothetical protein H6682_22880 [Candidatus Eisenbacteria bacterium]|nr:hypothetical protein [Candidatus Eisenbacteria bacterium]